MKEKEGFDTSGQGAAIVRGDINIQEGDFVGRDYVAFSQVGVVGDHASIEGDVSYHTQAPVTPIEAQITRLRGRISRLIPAEESIRNLAHFREPATIANRVGGEIGVRMPIPLWGEVTGRFYMKPAKKERANQEIEVDSSQEYLGALSMIESKISPDLAPEERSQLLQRLSDITDDVNVRISRLNNAFVSLVYPATSSVELVANIVSKIGHRELREEAKMHLGVVERLAQRLDQENLTRPEIDVVGDEAQSAVGIMTEIEKHRFVVERLLQSDRKRRNVTVATVILYIVLVIAAMIYTATRWTSYFLIGEAPLSTMRIPLLGIPWPVIVWSLVGSIAAMINRFNRRPIHDFSDAVKWMLTRPVQGMVLGAAFYLVLVSGLFLLTSNKATDESGVVIVNEAMLVLSFLVGFSDRFADSVFNALVERYSKPAEPPKPTDETEQEDEEAPQ